MVHRKKDFSSPPSELTDIKWRSLKKKAIKEMNAHKAKKECYRDCTIDALEILYCGKCSMCERKRGSELQVDHYRPHKMRNNGTNTKYNQPGYYWLTYEWSNLLPLCSTCNREKSNKFPLYGFAETNRIKFKKRFGLFEITGQYSVKWLNIKEKPLLINPELEEKPVKHFWFTNQGKIKGRTLEGKETIEICKLNRKDLIIERNAIIQGYLDSINRSVFRFKNSKNTNDLKAELRTVFDTIKVASLDNAAFSLFGANIFHHFHYYISSQIDSKYGIKIKNYFVEYIDSIVKD